MVLGLTLIVTMTAGGVPELTTMLTFWLLVPPLPVQVRV
jgi:hypothetical protein